MQSYFTILSANIRPEIDEKVSLGLLLVSGKDVYFNYSKDKLNITKELMQEATFKYIKDVLKQVAAEVADKANIENKADMFEKGKVSVNPLFSLGYIEYLTKYSNGILNFSTPKIIERKADETLVKTLYKKYIDETNKGVVIAQPNKIELARPTFYPKVQSQFNIEKKFTSKEIPNLPISLKIDMMGQNELPTYAQFIDLESKPYHIAHNFGIITTLNQVFEGKHVGFVISSEPNKKQYPEQHNEWQQLRITKIAKYVDVSEIDSIKEYADKHNVKPLVEEPA